MFVRAADAVVILCRVAGIVQIVIAYCLIPCTQTQVVRRFRRVILYPTSSLSASAKPKTHHNTRGPNREKRDLSLANMEQDVELPSAVFLGSKRPLVVSDLSMTTLRTPSK